MYNNLINMYNNLKNSSFRIIILILEVFIILLFFLIYFSDCSVFTDIARKNQISFQDSASPIMEGIIDLHDYIIYFLIIILSIVVYLIWSSLTYYMRLNIPEFVKQRRILHDNILEFIWTVLPTFVLISIALPSFFMIYAMDEAIDATLTIHVVGHQWYWSYEYNVQSRMSFLLSKLIQHSLPAGLKGHELSEIKEMCPHLGDKQAILDYKICLYLFLCDLQNLDEYWNNETFLNRVHYRYLIEWGLDKEVSLLWAAFPSETEVFEKARWALQVLEEKDPIERTLDTLLVINKFGIENLKGEIDPSDINFINSLTIVKNSIQLNSLFECYLTLFDLKELTPEEVDRIRTLSALQNFSDACPENSEEVVEFARLKLDSYLVTDDSLNKGDIRLLEVDNVLVLPSEVHIRFLITSEDVIHSFAIPSLGIKVDCLPGRLNQAYVYIKRPGIYYGQCSEICGVGHGYMPIKIIALPFEYWYNWLLKNAIAKFALIGSKK